MSLSDPPASPSLIAADAPFLLTAWWWSPETLAWDGASPHQLVVYIAAAEHPGAFSHEYAIADVLAEQVSQVHHDELPIALCLRHGGEGWRFEYLGGPEWFTGPQAPIEPVAPTPMSPEQLSEQAQALLRDSLGLPPESPLPDAAGQLPAAEQPEEPYRFDPGPHMDLSKAEAAPAWKGEQPATAPPGPPPAPNARTSPVPPIPEAAPPGPPPDPNAEPFVH